MSPPSPPPSSVPQRKSAPTTPGDSADDTGKSKSPVTSPHSLPTLINAKIVTRCKQGAPAELAAVVDDLLDSLSKKFATVSTEIFEKLDSMSRRLDAMEQALNDSAGK